MRPDVLIRCSDDDVRMVVECLAAVLLVVEWTGIRLVPVWHQSGILLSQLACRQ